MVKRIKEHRISDTCDLCILDCSNTSGARFKVQVIYDSIRYCHTDYPILYNNGKIGWDFPEAIPQYAKENKVIKEFLLEAEKLNHSHTEESFK